MPALLSGLMWRMAHPIQVHNLRHVQHSWQGTVHEVCKVVQLQWGSMGHQVLMGLDLQEVLPCQSAAALLKRPMAAVSRTQGT